ncbi:MAG: general secretion pathway protein GspB [Stenotrophobium sp.]
MSFILDALRKAERERNLGKAPDLHAMTRAAMHGYGNEANRYRNLRLAILIGLIVGSLVALAVLHHLRVAARKTPPPAVAAAPAPTPTPTPTPAVTTAAAPLGPPDDGFAGADSPLAADDTVGSDSGVNSLDELAGESTIDDQQNAPRPLPAQVPHHAAAQSPDEEAADAGTTATAKAAGPGVQSIPAPAHTANTPATTVSTDTDTDDSDATDAQSTTAPGAATVAPAPDAVQKVSLAPAPAPAVPLLKDMPQEYRSAFPTLTVDVHSYDPHPGKSFVMVNGRNYHAGDTLAEGPRIVSIVVNGIVFSYRGQQVLFTIGAK